MICWREKILGDFRGYPARSSTFHPCSPAGAIKAAALDLRKANPRSSRGRVMPTKTLVAAVRWGIGPATRLDEVSIKVSTATGAQLRELLKKLPEGMTFELNLEKEDD